MTAEALNLTAALPEAYLAFAAMVLLMIGAFRGQKSTTLVSWLAVASIAFTAILVASVGGGRHLAFGGLFVADSFGVFMKILVLVGSALGIIMSL